MDEPAGRSVIDEQTRDQGELAYRVTGSRHGIVRNIHAAGAAAGRIVQLLQEQRGELNSMAIAAGLATNAKTPEHDQQVVTGYLRGSALLARTALQQATDAMQAARTSLETAVGRAGEGLDAMKAMGPERLARIDGAAALPGDFERLQSAGEFAGLFEQARPALDEVRKHVDNMRASTGGADSGRQAADKLAAEGPEMFDEISAKMVQLQDGLAELAPPEPQRSDEQDPAAAVSADPEVGWATATATMVAAGDRMRELEAALPEVAEAVRDQARAVDRSFNPLLSMEAYGLRREGLTAEEAVRVVQREASQVRDGLGDADWQLEDVQRTLDELTDSATAGRDTLMDIGRGEPLQERFDRLAAVTAAAQYVVGKGRATIAAVREDLRPVAADGLGGRHLEVQRAGRTARELIDGVTQEYRELTLDLQSLATDPTPGAKPGLLVRAERAAGEVQHAQAVGMTPTGLGTGSTRAARSGTPQNGPAARPTTHQARTAPHVPGL
ncbi:hypothetical protein AB0E69_02350 [Kribbella sp. NPDC026611]|uniref:hypothetical protein n=1 Tax=Kribbella sp. NPDC026611 TaxID=3154911 RepID=UPI0033E95E71